MRRGTVRGGEELTGRLGTVAIAVLVAAVLVAGPARADTEVVEAENPWPGDLSQVSPYEDAFSADRTPGKGVGFLASVGSMVMSAVTLPVKMVVGLTGAMTGGLAGAMNGGDEEAAAGIWNVTTDGSYYATPQVLEGRQPFRMTGDHP